MAPTCPDGTGPAGIRDLLCAYRDPGSGLDPVVVTEAALARAAEPALAATFITLTPERALTAARDSARRYRDGRPRGPLDGIPVSWKDLFDVAGTVTTAGAALRAGAAPADRDSDCVVRLDAAGTVCIGKTNLSEFAFSGLGLNPHFGTPPNPHARGTPVAPGGSSSGAAVSVAAGVVPCAVGTDTSGSVRVPAAFNGLIGFRPSRGRYPGGGVFPLSRTLDRVGTIARSVADIIALDHALYGGVRETGAGTGRPDVVVPEGIMTDGMAPAVAANLEAALRRMERAGHRIVRRRVAAVETAHTLMREHGTIVAAEAYRLHRAILDGPDAGRLDPRIRARLDAGADIPADSYVHLLTEREGLIRHLAADLDSAMLACATVVHTAPPRAPLERDAEAFARVNALTLRNTMIGSYLDLPGVALPTGTDADGLPTSLLLSAPAGDDERLLAAIRALERAGAMPGTGWFR
ncbi:amidase family protein [Azospirillum halopraeferens]|uniref:amidase family protein n=1 Tax=Azospirillum halopraeferens TaxID=34010 RepID=UPI0004183565|nr:amidase family protein [Azospirillum halopraeferens]